MDGYKKSHVFGGAKQLLVQQRMTTISRMLDEAKLDTATGEQKRILADLRQLIDLLQAKARLSLASAGENGS